MAPLGFIDSGPRTRRAAGDAAAAAGTAARPRAHDPRAAVRPRDVAVADRGGGRRLPDARVPADHAQPRHAARGSQRRGLTGPGAVRNRPAGGRRRRRRERWSHPERCSAGRGRAAGEERRPATGAAPRIVTRRPRSRQNRTTSSVCSASASKPSARATERLERGGYITRQQDPDDRRRAVLTLTPRGPRPLRAVGAARRAVDEELIQRFGEQRLEALLETLRAVITAVDGLRAGQDWRPGLCRGRQDGLGHTVAWG